MYPLTDAILLQKPQSCLFQGSGALNVSALVGGPPTHLTPPTSRPLSSLLTRVIKVRNDLLKHPVNLKVSYLVPRGTKDGNPVPALMTQVLPMTPGQCVGVYTFYSLTGHSIPGGLSYLAKLDVTGGTGSAVFADSFKSASDLSAMCVPYTGSAVCSNGTLASSATSSWSATGSISRSALPVTTPLLTRTESIHQSPTSTAPLTTTTASIPTASSVSPDLGGKQLVGGYTFVGCWTEGTGVRALRDASFSYDTMTLESCAAHCTGRAYFGAEYGRECYCGDALDASSGPAPGGPPDCSFPCAGNAAERCGAGNRLQLYSTTASQAASTPTPTPTPTAKKTVGAYTFVGCATEGSDGRALSQLSYESDTMTLESCASFCSRFRHFGTEYSRECEFPMFSLCVVHVLWALSARLFVAGYCAGSLADSSKNASLSDCSMSCAGNGLEYCGGPNRLQLYTRNVSAPQLPSAIKKVLSSTGLEWTYQNCMTEGYDVRALSAAFNAADNMTLEGCAGFCGGYTYFGTEYGRECKKSALCEASHVPLVCRRRLGRVVTDCLRLGYCGNSFNNGSVQAAQTDCSMFCSGNPAQFCGAGNRLSVFTR